jgi:hypothetical protein
MALVTNLEEKIFCHLEPREMPQLASLQTKLLSQGLVMLPGTKPELNLFMQSLDGCYATQWKVEGQQPLHRWHIRPPGVKRDRLQACPV